MKKLHIEAGFAVFTVLLSVIYGVKLTAFAVFAAIFHELGHLAALSLFRIPVKSIYAGFGGFRIEYSELTASYTEEAAAAVAGPLASLVLSFASSAAGNIAKLNGAYLLSGVSLIFFIFNMLPASPLDGGRALAAVNSRLLGLPAAAGLSFVLDIFVCVFLFAFGAYVILNGNCNFTQLISAFAVLSICCKNRRGSVKFLKYFR